MVDMRSKVGRIRRDLQKEGAQITDKTEVNGCGHRQRREREIIEVAT